MSARLVVADVLVASGVVAQVLCVVGVCWMRDSFDKLHFAAASSTVGPLLVGASVVVAGFPSASATIQCVVAVVALMALNPVLTHVTARLAWQQRADDATHATHATHATDTSGARGTT